MAETPLSEQEWQTFVKLAVRLGIDVPDLMDRDVSFTELESAGHRLGRAVAQATTERLSFAQAERIEEPQPCPTCQRPCSPEYRERKFTTVDGPIDLREPACHCSTCRRDFFPSASNDGD